MPRDTFRSRTAEILARRGCDAAVNDVQSHRSGPVAYQRENNDEPPRPMRTRCLRNSQITAISGPAADA